ncbi:MAG: DUF4339 domain-containing protein [Pirellulales bacterium]
MAKEFYVRVMGAETGPMDAAELVTMAREGRIGPDDHVRRGAAGEWREALTVQGLFDKAAPVATGYSKARAANPQAFLNEPRSLSTSFKIAMFVIVASIVGLVVFGMLRHPEGTASGAISRAQELVRDRLKVPSKAEFIADSIVAKHEGQGLWQVRGEVDAPNALGIPLRHNWFVDLKYADGQWKVKEVQVIAR